MLGDARMIVVPISFWNHHLLVIQYFFPFENEGLAFLCDPRERVWVVLCSGPPSQGDEPQRELNGWDGPDGKQPMP